MKAETDTLIQMSTVFKGEVDFYSIFFSLFNVLKGN